MENRKCGTFVENRHTGKSQVGKYQNLLRWNNQPTMKGGKMHDYNNHNNNRYDNHDSDNGTIMGSELMDKIMIFMWGVTLGVVAWRIHELFALGIWGW